MFKLDLEKAEEPEIKLPTSSGSLKKQESSRKIEIHTEGTFHAKMGTIKDRNGMDLTEAEDIKKR